MGRTLEVKEAARRIHAVTVALGRLAPLRDPVADAAALDLSAVQIHVLIRLGHDGPLTMGTLAGRVGVSLPACTRVVDRMKEDGLLLRERDPADRRVVVVRLAAAGRRLFERMDTRLQEKLAHLLTLLEGEERAEFVRLVEKLLAGLETRLASGAGLEKEERSCE